MSPGSDGVLFTRVWWTADVRRDAADGVLLVPRPGARYTSCWVRTLEPFNDRVEAGERLTASVGDVFVVCGPSVAETLIATVSGIGSRGELRVDLAHGEIAADTTVVQMTAANGVRARRKQKAVA